MRQTKTHKRSFEVERNPLMPAHVREQNERERLRGTLCGYMAPLATLDNGDVTCKRCLRELDKSGDYA